MLTKYESVAFDCLYHSTAEFWNRIGNIPDNRNELVSQTFHTIKCVYIYIHKSYI